MIYGSYTPGTSLLQLPCALLLVVFCWNSVGFHFFVQTGHSEIRWRNCYKWFVDIIILDYLRYSHSYKHLWQQAMLYGKTMKADTRKTQYPSPTTKKGRSLCSWGMRQWTRRVSCKIQKMNTQEQPTLMLPNTLGIVCWGNQPWIKGNRNKDRKDKKHKQKHLTMWLKKNFMKPVQECQLRT